jgi:hypothetical protein
VPGGAGAGPDLRAVRRHRREHRARRRVEEHLHGNVEDDRDDPGKHGRLRLLAVLDELQVDRRHLQDRRGDVARNQVTAPIRRLGRRHEIQASHGVDAYVHEGRVVLEGDSGGGDAVDAVDGAVARGGHDDRRGERQPERAQAEQEGHRLGAIRRGGGHHMAVGSVHEDARTLANFANHDVRSTPARIDLYIQGNVIYMVECDCIIYKETVNIKGFIFIYIYIYDRFFLDDIASIFVY